MRERLIDHADGGDAFTAWTLEAMADFARQGVRQEPIIQLARDVVVSAARRPRAQAAALLDFVRGSVAYIPDPLGVELVQSPAETLRRGCGDCDDHATLLATLAGCVGIHGAFKAVALKPDGLFVHVYTELLADGRWFAADSTMPHWLGWEPPHALGLRLELAW